MNLKPDFKRAERYRRAWRKKGTPIEAVVCAHLANPKIPLVGYIGLDDRRIAWCGWCEIYRTKFEERLIRIGTPELMMPVTVERFERITRNVKRHRPKPLEKCHSYRQKQILNAQAETHRPGNVV